MTSQNGHGDCRTGLTGTVERSGERMQDTKPKVFWPGGTKNTQIHGTFILGDVKGKRSTHIIQNPVTQPSLLPSPKEKGFPAHNFHWFPTAPSNQTHLSPQNSCPLPLSPDPSSRPSSRHVHETAFVPFRVCVVHAMTLDLCVCVGGIFGPLDPSPLR